MHGNSNINNRIYYIFILEVNATVEIQKFRRASVVVLVKFMLTGPINFSAI